MWLCLVTSYLRVRFPCCLRLALDTHGALALGVSTSQTTALKCHKLERDPTVASVLRTALLLL